MQERRSVIPANNAIAKRRQIVIENLAKIFETKNGKTTAFENLSFTVAAGEFVAIIGPSGCGKSTILRTLIGLEKPTAGHLTIESTMAGRIPEIGMMFQEHGLFPWMSLRENLRFPLKNSAQLTAQQIEERCDRFLQDVGLAEFANFYPHQVSGGMRQRASLARSFACQFDILLMDEPFVYLDFQTRWQLQELFIRLWQDLNTTVIFVTHDIEEAILLADRIIVMTPHPGQIKAEYIIPFPRHRDALALKRDPLYPSYVSRIMKDLEK